MSDLLLEVANLTTVFDVPGKPITAVDDVSFEIRRGEILGLVGESGSGKSVLAFSIVDLLPPPGHVKSGRVFLLGRDLLALPAPEMRKVRGAGIGLVFQEPTAALNPVMRVGAQVGEALIAHGLATSGDVRARVVELLRAVRITDPDLRVDDYPHQMSGGMRQRVMIAIALACRPPLVIADEPTTALDVTVQAQILELLRGLTRESHVSLLLITHDLGVVAETADRVAVMYAGRIVEEGPVRDVFDRPLHPYTQGLLASLPGRHAGARLHAIDGVVPSLVDLPRGCTFAPRCRHRMNVCTMAVPTLAEIEPAHSARCYLHDPGFGRSEPGRVGAADAAR